MKAIFKLVTLSLLTLGLSACAGSGGDSSSSDDQAKTRAEKLVQEQNTLGKELNGMGTPRSTWDNAKLDSYEAKINRLEAVEKELAQVNGKGGVTIHGANNQTVIASMRSQLNTARVDRARNLSVDQTLQELKKYDAEVSSLVAEIGELVESLGTSQDPKQKAVVEKNIDDKLVASLESYQKQLKILEASKLDQSVKNTASASIRQQLERLQQMRDDLKASSEATI